MKTLIRHLACGELIFMVDRKLINGDLIQAHEWKLLDDKFPQPVTGERMICPNCLVPFMPCDEQLQRVFVDRQS